MDDLRQYFDRLARGEILEEKRREYAIEPLGEGAMFAYARESALGSVRERWVVHRLGCAHVALTPQEYTGNCERCDTSVCHRAECHARCRRCGILACASCIRTWQGSAYCRGCRRIEMVKTATLAGTKGLHALLSRKI